MADGRVLLEKQDDAGTLTAAFMARTEAGRTRACGITTAEWRRSTTKPFVEVGYERLLAQRKGSDREPSRAADKADWRHRLGVASYIRTRNQCATSTPWTGTWRADVE